MPRYEFQRLRWAKRGYKNLDLSLQYEISIQSIANVTFLSLPAIFQAHNPTPYLTVLETIGYALWVVSLVGEHIADFKNQDLPGRLTEKEKRELAVMLGFGGIPAIPTTLRNGWSRML